jgi:hypothetical protein
MSSAKTGPRRTDGWVYGIVNPAWPGRLKVGRAVNLSRRLHSYNTGAPDRDYSIGASLRFRDAHLAEAAIHERLAGLRIKNTEWFWLHPDDFFTHLQRMKEDLE